MQRVEQMERNWEVFARELERVKKLKKSKGEESKGLAGPYGIIKRVIKVHDFPAGTIFPEVYGSYDGYVITTTEHIFWVLISSYKKCCEEWGCITSEDEDDIGYYVGKRLLDVEVTDIAFNKRVLEHLDKAREDHIDYSGCVPEVEQTVFVNFVTHVGEFQLVVYNLHNSYYGHEILLAYDDKVLMNPEI